MCARGAHSHVPGLTHCFNSAYPQVNTSFFRAHYFFWEDELFRECDAYGDTILNNNPTDDPTEVCLFFLPI